MARVLPTFQVMGSLVSRPYGLWARFDLWLCFRTKQFQLITTLLTVFIIYQIRLGRDVHSDLSAISLYSVVYSTQPSVRQIRVLSPAFKESRIARLPMWAAGIVGVLSSDGAHRSTRCAEWKSPAGFGYIMALSQSRE